jgi:tetratricopeptide (TPR) repeat protein
LFYYEFGEYGNASKAWRQHYGLSYDLNLIDNLKESLIKRIKENPDEVQNYLWLADLYFFIEDYASAGLIYQKALQKNKDVYDAKVGLASTLLAQGKYHESQPVFENFFNQRYHETNVTSFLNFLIALDKLKNSNIPDNGDRYLALTYAYRYLGIIDKRRYKEVITYADKTISTNKNLKGAFFSKGVVYKEEKKYDLALEQFSKVIEIDSSNAEVYLRMAYLYGEVGNLEKELESYKKAAELKENNPDYAFHLGKVLVDKYGDMKEANFYLKKAYDLSPDRYAYATKYGYTLEMLRRFDEALAVYDRLIIREPRNPEAYESKGYCLIRMEKYEEAIRLYLKAKEIRPLDFLSACNLGKAYSQLKKFEEATSMYEYALKMKPYDVDTLLYLQYLYRLQGRYEEAYRTTTEVLRIQPNHIGAQRTLTYLERNLKRK